MNNRLMHFDEKERIRIAAGGDVDKQERWTKAACFEIKCWAQFPEGSDLYKANYVSVAEMSGLQAEWDWVKRQKDFGAFNYTPLQKFTDWVASSTGLIVRTPINPPKTADTIASNRDRLTGLPLDEKGRYEVNLTLGDKNYSPKFYPCATAECVKSGGNLDMNDAGTRAYVKALDQQVFKDIGTGATAATLATPLGAAGRVLFWLGAAASGGQAATSDKPTETGFDEFMKAVSEKGGAKVFEEVLGHTPGAAARASALINLAGGWDAFVNRVKIDLFGMKPNDAKK
jgi:hypothetical protein